MINKPIIQRVVVGGVIFNKRGSLLIIQRSKNEDIYLKCGNSLVGNEIFLKLLMTP